MVVLPDPAPPFIRSERPPGFPKNVRSSPGIEIWLELGLFILHHLSNLQLGLIRPLVEIRQFQFLAHDNKNGFASQAPSDEGAVGRGFDADLLRFVKTASGEDNLGGAEDCCRKRRDGFG